MSKLRLVCLLFAFYEGSGMGLTGLGVHNGGLMEWSGTDFSVSTEFPHVFMNIRNASSSLVELLSLKNAKVLEVDIGNEFINNGDEKLGKSSVGHIQMPSDYLRTSYCNRPRSPSLITSVCPLSPLNRFVVVVSPAAVGIIQQRLSSSHYRRASRHRSGAWIGGGDHHLGERRTLIISYSSQLCFA